MPRGVTEDAVQLSLFGPVPRGRPGAALASPAALSADSTLDVARWWYRRFLTNEGRPKNTVDSYTYDLVRLEALVGRKPLRLIDERDIGAFLEAAPKKSTRKRRLTSAREFWGYLIGREKLLTRDPTTPYYPERIHLKTPVPLFPAERERLVDAAREDGPTSFLIVYLPLELGLNRAETLSLRRQQIDTSDADAPIVYVSYVDPRWRHKERHLRGDARLAGALDELELPPGDEDFLIPYRHRPPLLNGRLERLVKKAGLERKVTPQLLRDTFGVEQARLGRTEEELLGLMGLANDPRNLDSVRRYVKLAAPPAEVFRDQS